MQGAEGVVQDTSCCLPVRAPSKKVSLGAVQKVRVVGGLQGRRHRGRSRCAVDEDDGVVGLRGRRRRCGWILVAIGVKVAWAIVRRGLGDRVGISFFFLAWPP